MAQTTTPPSGLQESTYVLLDWVNANRETIYSGVGLLNQAQVPADNWATVTGARNTLVSKLRPYIQARQGGQAISDRVCIDIWLDFARSVEAMGRAVITKQDAVLASGKYTLDLIDYHLTADVLEFYNAARVNILVDSIAPSQDQQVMREIHASMKTLNAKQKANVAKATDMAKAAIAAAAQAAAQGKPVERPAPPTPVVTPGTAALTAGDAASPVSPVAGKMPLIIGGVVAALALLWFLNRR